MTEGKNRKLEPQEEQPKLDEKQYKWLKECSKKGAEGIKEWNKWRKENQYEEICLQGANLVGAELQGAGLFMTNLQGANLTGANLQGACLQNANLQGADLQHVNLQLADLFCANLQGASLFNTNLQGTKLWNADLQGSNLWSADLQGTNLWNAKLQGAKLMGVIVNGSTNFLECKIDENTDFRETALENVRIESGTKTLLKYNIRRMNWEDWYAEHRFWQWPVKIFWKMSDYGRSTLRIMLTFFVLATGFAFVYFGWPCCVMVNNEVGDIRGFVHALYFSVVTMTTLGFGDIAANPDSWPGQVVLMVQVILGYVLLGALVTRLAVLFTSDGPAGSFTPMDKEKKELLANLEEDKKKAKQ